MSQATVEDYIEWTVISEQKSLIKVKDSDSIVNSGMTDWIADAVKINEVIYTNI